MFMGQADRGSHGPAIDASPVQRSEIRDGPRHELPGLRASGAYPGYDPASIFASM